MGTFLPLYVIKSFGLLLSDIRAVPSPGRLLTTQHRDSDSEASPVVPLLPPPGWAGCSAGCQVRRGGGWRGTVRC